MSISETNAINISKVLTEALPYIRKFNNKVVNGDCFKEFKKIER